MDKQYSLFFDAENNEKYTLKITGVLGATGQSN
jgi:hypothetical protein